MNAIEKLKEMEGKTFLFDNEEVAILRYYDCVGENGDECEIVLSNGKTLVYSMGDLIIKLERFRPVTKNMLILVNQRINSVSSVNPTVINELKDIVMDQIKQLKGENAQIEKAKTIFNGVSTMINLAKTELEYRKYINQQIGNEYEKNR